ncbi:hypothetical protein Tco_1272495 [Tanacetum coccineum]
MPADSPISVQTDCHSCTWSGITFLFRVFEGKFSRVVVGRYHCPSSEAGSDGGVIVWLYLFAFVSYMFLSSRNNVDWASILGHFFQHEFINSLCLSMASTFLEMSDMPHLNAENPLLQDNGVVTIIGVIQPADHTSDDGPSYESAFISEVQSSSIDENNEPMYPTHTKIINSTIHDDQINSNIKFNSFKGNVNSGSVDKDTHVPDLCAVEKLARNAYQEAEKQ